VQTVFDSQEVVLLFQRKGKEKPLTARMKLR